MRRERELGKGAVASLITPSPLPTPSLSSPGGTPAAASSEPSEPNPPAPDFSVVFTIQEQTIKDLEAKQRDMETRHRIEDDRARQRERQQAKIISDLEGDVRTWRSKLDERSKGFEMQKRVLSKQQLQLDSLVPKQEEYERRIGEFVRKITEYRELELRTHEHERKIRELKRGNDEKDRRVTDLEKRCEDTKKIANINEDRASLLQSELTAVKKARDEERERFKSLLDAAQRRAGQQKSAEGPSTEAAKLVQKDQQINGTF
jgi:chromosome segregation ATPase